VDDLGGTLLELLHGDPDRQEVVEGVAIYDAVDDQPLARHALVLGVGLHEPGSIGTLLHE
jgi:hypothetical protein